MLNSKQIKEVFLDTVDIKEYDSSVIINTNMLYLGSGQTMAVAVFEQDGHYILSDMGETYNRLKDEDFDLNLDEDIKEYKNRVLSSCYVVLENDELTTFAEDIKQLPLALGRLQQCMILLTYLPMQFDEE